MSQQNRYRSAFAPGLFAGRVVVVTGGGSGIGRCIAHELVALGAAVAIVGRTPEKLDRVAADQSAAFVARASADQVIPGFRPSSTRPVGRKMRLVIVRRPHSVPVRQIAHHAPPMPCPPNKGRVRGK